MSVRLKTTLGAKAVPGMPSPARLNHQPCARHENDTEDGEVIAIEPPGRHSQATRATWGDTLIRAAASRAAITPS
jgi:hypothetical protein